MQRSMTCTSSGGYTVTASGGAGTLVYSWAPSGGTAATASSLAAGTYTVTVSGTTCAANYKSVVTIGKKSPLVTVSPINSCSSSLTFAATASAGSGSYAYSWSGGLGTLATSGTSTQPVTANTVNSYTVTVTDNTTACVNTAVCSHYANHSVSVTGNSSANYCCEITLTATYIPGATYSWTKNGVTINPATYPSAATHILTGGFGYGTFIATANTGNLDPCSDPAGTKVVTNAGGNACNCSERPERTFNLGSTNEKAIIASAIDLLLPNPSSDLTTINYHLNSEVSNAIIVVTDLMGCEKTRFALNVKENQADLQCSQYSEGIYFITLITDQHKISVKKLMIVK